MKQSGDLAGHELAKANERDKSRQDSLKALETAKAQEKSRNGKFVYDTNRKAYFFKSQESE